MIEPSEIERIREWHIRRATGQECPSSGDDEAFVTRLGEIVLEKSKALEAALGEIERLNKEIHTWKPTGPHTTQDMIRIIGDPRRGVEIKVKGD